MKIFYLCVNGDLTGVIGGALHLGLLPANKLPTRDQILGLRHFAMSPTPAVGTPIFLGVDRFGHQVYSIGVLQESRVAVRTVESLLRLFALPAATVVTADTVTCGGWRLQLAGLFFRWGLRSWGLRLAIPGIRRCYPDLVQLAAWTAAASGSGALD